MKLCDACGSPKAYISMGGAMICRDCDPDIRAEMEKLRSDGKPVNVLHIAKRFFRETHNGGNYLLRDIPDNLWHQVQHYAVDNNMSLHDIILAALYKFIN